MAVATGVGRELAMAIKPGVRRAAAAVDMEVTAGLVPAMQPVVWRVVHPLRRHNLAAGAAAVTGALAPPAVARFGWRVVWRMVYPLRRHSLAAGAAAVTGA